MPSKFIIDKWGQDQIKLKQEECSNWWSEYKNNIQEFIKNKINL